MENSQNQTPATKAKKPFYKRWYGIIILSFGVLMVIGMIGSALESPEAKAKREKERLINETTNTNSKESDSKIQPSGESIQDNKFRVVLAELLQLEESKDYLKFLNTSNELLKVLKNIKPSDEKLADSVEKIVKKINKNINLTYKMARKQWYDESLYSTLWNMDIHSRILGSKNDKLHLWSGRLARNSEKQQVIDNLITAFKHLNFKTIEIGWIEHDNEATIWTISKKSDEEFHKLM